MPPHYFAADIGVITKGFFKIWAFGTVVHIVFASMSKFEFAVSPMLPATVDTI